MKASDNQTRAAHIFLHIPKTVGSTLRRILCRQYDKEDIFVINGPDYQRSIDTFKSLSQNEKAKFQLICGHMGFGLHEVLSRPAVYLVILRDPVQRVLSLYYHSREKAIALGYTPLSLERFVESGRFLGVDNGQTRLLSATGGRLIGEAEFGDCSQQMLEIAKERLCPPNLHLGLLDQFDTALVLFRRTLGWGIPWYARARVNRGRPRDVPSEFAQLIRQRNELDLELYTYAQRVFQREVASQGSGFGVELGIFGCLNRPYDFSVSTARRCLDVVRRSRT